MSSTEDVLDHHLDAFGAQDMEENLKDYGEDSVLITHSDVFRGIDEIEGDVAYITWNAETPENVYEFATDTFLIRDGGIETQTLGAVVSSKD